MSAIECEIVSSGRNFPVAVLGPRTLVVEEGWWILDLQEIEVWQRTASQILSFQAIFDAKLSKRWGRLVACLPVFSEVWDAQDGEPSGHKIARLV